MAWSGTIRSLGLDDYVRFYLDKGSAYQFFHHACDSLEDCYSCGSTTPHVSATFRFTRPPGLSALWCAVADATRRWMYYWTEPTSPANTFVNNQLSHVLVASHYLADKYQQLQQGVWTKVPNIPDSYALGNVLMPPSTNAVLSGYYTGACSSMFVPAMIGPGFGVVVKGIAIGWQGTVNGAPVRCVTDVTNIPAGDQVLYTLGV